MNNLVIIGSSIQPKDGIFTYSNTRSSFSAEERFRQTFFTINSIKNCLPDSRIIIVDTSDNYMGYLPNLAFMKDVDYVPIKDISYSAFELVNTHQNKSYCESLLLNTFYKSFKKEIQNYDYIIKATGRYFYFDFNDSLFDESNLNKFFFKKSMKFKWNPAWNYSMIDRRAIQQDDMLRQYCTVLYAFGKSNLDAMIDINEATIKFLESKEMVHYDIETLSYYLTRPYEDRMIETDWKVAGWDGVSGQFMYY
jgi:hypothetical protein